MTTSDMPGSRTLESLPDELLMQIISFIKPRDLVPLHKTSNRLRALTRQDPHLWRNKTIATHDEQIAQTKCHRPSIAALIPDDTVHDGPAEKPEEGYSRHLPPNITASGGKKIDWYEEWKWRFAPLRMEWLDHYPRDPSAWGTGTGGESTDEDDDNLGLSTSMPSTCSSSATSLTSLSGGKSSDLEVRGLTAFSSSGTHGDRDMLFSPFSDGSVAVFDLRRFGRRRLDHSWDDDDYDDDDGCRLLGRSKPGLVSVATSTGRGSYLVGGNGGRTTGGVKTTRAPNGVVECVSVDPWSGKGWVAVEGRLIEIDLRTLQRVAEHKLPFAITALSQTSNPHPLTVCTTSFMHLYDPRIPVNGNFSGNTMAAPLHQTGALSILHSNNGQATGGEEMIFLAGRFKAILAYERRMFPKMKVPMYTGARLCTLSSFPSPLRGNSAFSEAEGANTAGGSVEMIVAGGEYNGHGSLEIYPTYAINNNLTRSIPDSNGFLPSYTGAHPQLKRYNHGVVNPNVNNPQHDTHQEIDTDTLSTVRTAFPAEIVRNRQSASRSKILSVDASQGTRIITGDGDGIIRWIERDGRQEVRRFDIFGDCGGHGDHNPYTRRTGTRWCDGKAGYCNRLDGTPRSEVVRKLVAFGDSTGGSGGDNGASQAGVVVWTGERLGILSVGQQRPRKPQHHGKIGGGGGSGGGGVAIVDGEEVPAENDAERYEIEMRKALERQGDELRIMKGLGMLSLG